MRPSLRTIIKANVRALLKLSEGEVGVQKLINKGITNGNAARVLSGETSIGIDLVDQVAAALKVPAWQLCSPGLGGALAEPPRAAEPAPSYAAGPYPWPLEPWVSRERWDRLLPAHQAAAAWEASKVVKAVEDEQPGPAYGKRPPRTA